ncbi:MAG: hypothetical protein AAF798_05415 [Bacteroidota bacterium]
MNAPHKKGIKPISQASNVISIRPLLLLTVVMIGAFLVIYLKKYDELVTEDANGNPALVPDRRAEIEKRKYKNSNEAEQYVLRAIAPGFVECYLCPDGKVWLEANEIAKIGVSTNGQDRYSAEYYRKHGLYYVMEYRGDLATAKNKEIERLGTYPLLPENQKREQRLIYPPLNSKLD